MNIYLCSTIRHLLFSVLKALDETVDKHTIFLISDQQSIDPVNFDCSRLPAHIKVIFIFRKTLRKQIFTGVKGNIIKQMANFNVKTSPSTRKKISSLLFNQTLGLSLTPNNIEQGQLFLFNDRNKISRLFRLAFHEYSLIEEGLANYGGIKLKKAEKFARFFSDNKREMRYFGDDKRCKTIYLVNPEKAPSALMKKVKNIDFIKAKNIQNYCKAFFKSPEIDNYDCILATQPLAHTHIDMQIYQKIIASCQDNKMSIAIKPHPREELNRYVELLSNIPLLESKLPLELVIFGSPKKCHILSLYSTVGIGFENYCYRHNVIKDNEQDNIQSLITSWQQSIDLVDKRIASLFDEIKKIDDQ